MALRGALVGCGFFAQNHLHAWREVDGAEIIAVCDTDAAKLAATADRFGIAERFTDAAAMLEAAKPDFVDIVTGPESHRPLVALAAGRGVPTICQKPFALAMADAEAMVAACAAAGVPLMVHENFRWQTPLLRLREAIDAGAVGRPFFARIGFRHGFDVFATQPYLAEVERFVILDLGVHLLDLARFYLGEVATLYAATARVNPRVRGEDTAAITLRHADGATAVIDISFYTQVDPDPFPQTLVRIEGTEGTAELGRDYALTLSGPGRPAELHNVEPPLHPWAERPWHVIQDSVVNIQRHWVDCLRHGRTPATSGADNLRTLALVFAAYESADAGQAVTLPHADPSQVK
jgi:predicted dehydrogenase